MLKVSYFLLPTLNELLNANNSITDKMLKKNLSAKILYRLAYVVA
jgi:hypothetical protein